MTYARHALTDDQQTIPQMPVWVTSAQPETLEDVAFLTGAALSHLQSVMRLDTVPQSLVRARLALGAAEACVSHHGRRERAADLRDEVAFLQPGDRPGPAGAVYLTWQRAVARPVSVATLHRALPEVAADQIATWLDGANPCDGNGTHGAGRAVSVLGIVGEERPRDQTTALLLADAALAQAFGWSHVVPLLSSGLRRGDLRASGQELRLACYRAIATAAVEAARLAVDLTRRAEQMRALAPKLRAKGAEAAVGLFLASDAVAPKSLTSLRSDRAARRFCDRLVELGVAREMTGRDTFRLYGI